MKTLAALFSKVWQVVRGLFGGKRAVKASSHMSQETVSKEREEVRTPLEEQVYQQELYLRRYYNSAVDPEVTFNIFYLRVTSFGWNKEEALYTEDKRSEKQVKVMFGGKQYNLKDIYDNCTNPKVNYNTFYNRVNVRGWGVRRALFTGSCR